MQDAWRAYLELTLGLTDASRRRAERIARELIARSGATRTQPGEQADELVSTNRGHRVAMARPVRKAAAEQADRGRA
jgi:hypothetical protein